MTEKRSIYSGSAFTGNSHLSRQFFDILKLNNKFQLIKFIKTPNAQVWLYTEDEGNNGLHVAVMRDLNHLIKAMFETIEELFPEDSKDIISEWINTPNNKGDTCLHYASYKGNYNLLKTLAKYNVNAKYKNKQGNTVMHNAAQGNQPLSFIFFNQKFNVSATEGNNDGSTPLHWACYTGSEIAFNFILSFYSNINIQDKDGLTPLHLAVISERTELVKKLLHKGANKKITDSKGRTAKQLAEQKGKDNISELLEEKLICSFLVLKNPIEKIERSNSNIYFFLVAHLIAEFLFFTVILPCKLK